jgi:hypothetical protein
MFFRYGERAAIARSAKIDTSNLYKILSRRRPVSLRLALRLEAASRRVLRNRFIPVAAWLGLKKHRAFAEK